MFIRNIKICTYDKQPDISNNIIEIAEDGTILKILPENYSIPDGIAVVDAKNAYLMPAAVDHHQHGAMGADWVELGSIIDLDSQKQYIETILLAQYHAGIGKTYATLVSTDYDNIDRFLTAIYNYLENPRATSYLKQILQGVHFEGPYLSVDPGCIGAHNYETVISAKYQDKDNLLNKISKFRAQYPGHKLKFSITIDFARLNSIEFAKRAKSLGVNIFIGHSNAGAHIIKDAIDQQLIIGVTHFGNGMGNLSHKLEADDISGQHSEIVQALFEYHENIIFELIVDQDNNGKPNHLQSSFIRLCIEKLGFAYLMLVSDALAPSLMPSGKYKLGKIDIKKIGQCIYVLDEDGKPIKLAGSANLLDHSIQVMTKYLIDFGYTRDNIAKAMLQMTFINPMRFLSPELVSANAQLINVGDNITRFCVFNPDRGDKQTYTSGIKYLERIKTMPTQFMQPLCRIYPAQKSKSRSLICVHDTSDSVGWQAAEIFSQEINNASSNNQKIVFIVPTGSSPLPMYRELVRRYLQGSLNFSDVIFFNMDEYVGLSPENQNSYHYFMMESFYQYLLDKPNGVKSSNIFIPDGTGSLDEVIHNAELYHRRLRSFLQSPDYRVVCFGGIGRGPAHIAFNDFTLELEGVAKEQSLQYALESKTRVVLLDQRTRIANMRFFNNDLEAVPTRAITIGFSEILACDNIIIMATDASKKEAIKSIFVNQPSYEVPASLLRFVKEKVCYLLTKDAYPYIDSNEIRVVVSEGSLFAKGKQGASCT